jgi:hypothetical protein
MPDSVRHVRGQSDASKSGSKAALDAPCRDDSQETHLGIDTLPNLAVIPTDD